MTKELAKTLTTALVQFIDRERPEGTMCCSNIDCENIRSAFEEGEYDCVEAFIHKKLSSLTEFEEGLVTFYNKRNMIPSNKDGVYNKHELEEFLHESAKTLLALAKKELLKEWNEDMKDEYSRGKKDGLTIGYNKAMNDYNESVAYHFPIMPTPPSGWGCDGTHCTNPHHDCINCPVKHSSGGTITTPNTASGTSSATLHGNTSVTDGKPHNPSFTD